MKILSCHISGFGKFVNRAFDLSQPIVVCKQENGWGKTTLADFIECMFYGLDNGRKSSVAENMRVKYEPWSGARYGGAIIIEEEGKTYRIERFFGKTPSADVTRVFDGNNVACYDFGERGERIGETLFGVDRESYRRTAYIPQGNTVNTPLTGDIKSKLLAILSATPSDSGAQKAMDRLDVAERALRAKRKPAKGKLDEIDERLAQIELQKAESLRASQTLTAQRETLALYTQKMQGYTVELQRLSTQLEEYTRRGELEANRAVRREMETTYENAAAALQELRLFFGDIDPKTLNTQGLEEGITEFYALKAEIEQGESKLSALYAQNQQRQLLQTQLDGCEKTIESYEVLAKAQEKQDKKKEKAKKKKTKGKYAKSQRRWGKFLLILGFCLAVFGGIAAEGILWLAIVLLALGLTGMIWGFVLIYTHTNGLSNAKKPRLTFDDPEVEARYNATCQEMEELAQKLVFYDEDGEKKYAALSVEIEGKKTRKAQLERAIGDFIAHFRFEAVYDYRAALSRIKECVADYLRFSEAENTYAQKLSAAAPVSASGIVADYSPADIQTLSQKRTDIEGKRETLRADYARLSAEAEGLETRALALQEYLAEETRLTEEKNRLERRLTAIRAAKEILSRARSNMATRYLDPIETHCKRYAEILGFTGGGLRFSGEGLPLMEENAALRSVDYYSTGMRELLDFCVRIALAETLFTGNRPALVLDDPFANLDDDKTARAKTLVKELSKKYQILYFTCKQERTL